MAKAKRLRSISGRLRSASDMTKNGTISAKHRGILKDLIIKADDERELEAAFDAYDAGDPSLLQGKIPLLVLVIIWSCILLYRLDREGELGELRLCILY